MTNEKLGQESAFPITDENLRYQIPCGISKRFYAACSAMQGILTNVEFLKANQKTALINKMQPDEFLIKTVYSLVDELLRQENE